MFNQIRTYICALILVLCNAWSLSQLSLQAFLCNRYLNYPLEQMATLGSDQDGKGSTTNRTAVLSKPLTMVLPTAVFLCQLFRVPNEINPFHNNIIKLISGVVAICCIIFAILVSWIFYTFLHKRL